MAFLSTFEVIAQPIAPGVPNVPFVQQGTFIQITNTSNTYSRNISVYFYPASPNFVSKSGDGALTLFANYVDNNGNIVQYPNFIQNYNGFQNIVLSPTATFLFGVQYIFTPPPNLSAVAMAGGTPQSSLTSRGGLELVGPSGATFLCTVTVRQVFNNYDENGNLQDVDESAYSLPVIGGPLVTLTAADEAPSPRE